VEQAPGGTVGNVTPPKHAARLTVPRQSALAAAWAVVIVAGTITMTYNIWHALIAGHMLWPLALLYGLGPVLLAALLSHVVAEYECGWVMKGIVFAAMIGGMAMSIGATAWTVGPTAGPVLRWVFGAVLDVAALAALRVILSSRARKHAAAGALETAHAEAEQAVQDRSRSEAELASVRAELDRVTAELGAQLQAVQAELEAARQAVLNGGPRKRSSSGPKRTRTAPEDDLALEARALDLLATDLNMSGAELGRKLGVTPGYGRKLRRRLTDPDRPVDRPGPLAQDRPQERSQDR
jgi:hypothetical protein